ncbi:MAG: hypothetical protein J7M25_17330 [Deltaproteobacteria bacterium]|nr:hypothetical protein [Deltaproteobacteria bacterium]
MNDSYDNILTTARLQLKDLVRQYCAKCEYVIIPPGAEEEWDIYRCRASAGRHCLQTVATARCVQRTSTEP